MHYVILLEIAAMILQQFWAKNLGFAHPSFRREGQRGMEWVANL